MAASFLHVFVRGRRRFLPAFIASLTAALYTHNWALFLGLACFVGFLAVVWLTPAGRARLWRDGALAFGSVAVLYLPWLPTLLYQATHTGAPWAAAPDLWSLTHGLLLPGRRPGSRGRAAAGRGIRAARRPLERPLPRARPGRW